MFTDFMSPGTRPLSLSILFFCFFPISSSPCRSAPQRLPHTGARCTFLRIATWRPRIHHTHSNCHNPARRAATPAVHDPSGNAITSLRISPPPPHTVVPLRSPSRESVHRELLRTTERTPEKQGVWLLSKWCQQVHGLTSSRSIPNRRHQPPSFTFHFPLSASALHALGLK